MKEDLCSDYWADELPCIRVELPADYWADELPCMYVELPAGLRSAVPRSFKPCGILEVESPEGAQTCRAEQHTVPGIAGVGQKRGHEMPLEEDVGASRRARVSSENASLCQASMVEAQKSTESDRIDASATGETLDSGEWHISNNDFDDILRWVECTRIGKPLANSRLVPCKTPLEGRMAEAALREELLGEEERFNKKDLLERCRLQGTPVGLVIDLVNTNKYYEGFSEEDGVEYQKLWIAGHAVPQQEVLETAFRTIDDFTARRPAEYVAIHCTHGVNRTGFFIVAYLLTRGHQRYASDAIKAFQEARGERIDKVQLIRALHRLEVKGWY